MCCTAIDVVCCTAIDVVCSTTIDVVCCTAIDVVCLQLLMLFAVQLLLLCDVQLLMLCAIQLLMLFACSYWTLKAGQLSCYHKDKVTVPPVSVIPPMVIVPLVSVSVTAAVDCLLSSTQPDSLLTSQHSSNAVCAMQCACFLSIMPAVATEHLSVFVGRFDSRLATAASNCRPTR